MPTPPLFPPKPDVDRFARRTGELRQVCLAIDPPRLAANTGATYLPQGAQQGEFHLTLWQRPVILTYPNFIAYPADRGAPLADIHLALLLYYFATADGIPLTERWISFADLPDGRFYNQAFQGYTGQKLARSFANDLPGFIQAAQTSGGALQSVGCAAFAFQSLPRVPLLAVYWQGDDDFPASCQVLFDASASHYLPTDAYAILGSGLTHRLIAAYSAARGATA